MIFLSDFLILLVFHVRILCRFWDTDWLKIIICIHDRSRSFQDIEMVSIEGHATSCLSSTVTTHCSVPKNETPKSWISCTVVSLLQWNLARDILMTLAIKRVHNCHLTSVTSLHYLILHKNRKLMLSFSQWRRRLWRESVLVYKWLWKEPAVCLGHSRCSKWRPFAFTHARSRPAVFATGSGEHGWTAATSGPLVDGFVDDALSNTLPSMNASAGQCRVSVFV